MSFFDIFKRNNPAPEPSRITVELGENSIVINRASINIPTHVDTLAKLLGTPRRVVCPKTDDGEQRTNYAWDDLGLYCYTKNGSTAHCLGIRLNPGELSLNYYPTEFFKGKVTINGAPWFNAIRGAENMDFFKQLMLGRYSVVCEFVDFEAEDASRTEKDYTGIEIQIG